MNVRPTVHSIVHLNQQSEDHSVEAYYPEVVMTLRQITSMILLC